MTPRPAPLPTIHLHARHQVNLSCHSRSPSPDLCAAGLHGPPSRQGNAAQHPTKHICAQQAWAGVGCERKVTTSPALGVGNPGTALTARRAPGPNVLTPGGCEHAKGRQSVARAKGRPAAPSAFAKAAQVPARATTPSWRRPRTARAARPRRHLSSCWPPGCPPARPRCPGANPARRGRPGPGVPTLS